MDYTVKEKKRWQAKPICGSDAFLTSCEDMPGIPEAEWIWGYFYARNLYRKDFALSSAPTKATAHFICDNSMDIYINGQLVAYDVRAWQADIAHLLQAGINAIGIRAFPTDREDRFTSSLCGKIEAETKDGIVTIVTDSSWQVIHPVDFGSNDEAQNWQTGTGLKESWLYASRLHHRLVKRSMYIRKGFCLSAPVKKTTLCVFSQGEAEMYLNGKKVSDEFLCQGIMEGYQEYRSFDVTDYIRPGKNALGAITGNTWLNSRSHSGTLNNPNALLAELTVTCENGEIFVLGTDRTFKTAPSPITDNHLQYGERYDARLEIENWCDPEFDDSGWYFAEEIQNGDLPYIERNYPPIKIQEQLAPVARWQEGDTLYYDFGCNCAGAFTLCLQNTTPGQTVKVSCAEQLNQKGEFHLIPYCPVFYPEDYQENGRAKATMKNYNLYICKGGRESYTPRFTFTGFRYLKVEGAKSNQVESITLNVMHNDLSFDWDITCSDPFYKQLAVITERSLKGNLFNGFMDCPTREKNYWTGDLGIFATTACFMADCHQLMARWTEAGRKMCPAVYGWGDEVYTLPVELYYFYGDKAFLRRRFPAILSYARDRVNTAGGILPVNPNSPFNDHCNPFNVPMDKLFFAGCFYCLTLSQTARIARILEETEIAVEFEALFAQAAKAFNDRYFLPEGNDYMPHTQSGLVLPLSFGITPENHRQAVIDRLCGYIQERGCLTTGFVTTRLLMPLLGDYGKSDIAYLLLANEDFPSWRYILSTGATTMTEQWLGMDPSATGESSKNHFTLGTVVGWMFEYLGGIRSQKSKPGFTEIYLQPMFIRQIGDFAVRYQNIKTAWRFNGNTVTYEFESPVPVKLELPDGSVTAYPAGKHSILYNA